MLEGYLNQTPKVIPNLQQEANQLSSEVLNKAHNNADVNGTVEHAPQISKADSAGVSLPVRSGQA